MATTTFAPGAAATTFTGTSADDTITINPVGATGLVTNAVNVGAGTDTVIFAGELAAGAAAAGVFTAPASTANSFQFGAAGGTFAIGAAEFLTFDNGTVSSSASVTPEQLLGDSISGEIIALNGDANAALLVPDFALDTVLGWNGSVVSSSAGWTIQSIEGQTAVAGTNVSVVEGGVIQGRATINAANNGIDVTAESAFHTSITEIGARQTMEIDVVLENAAGATFEETLSVDVVGVASSANNTFAGTDGNDSVDGLAGDDTLRGDAGDDTIFGNDGDDVMFAGPNDAGNDVIVGGAGNDIVGGGAGDDILIGNSHVGLTVVLGAATDDGANTMFGGAGDDVMAVGGYNDATADLIAGNTGTATIAEFTGAMGGTAYAGAGDDEVYGSATGDDTIGVGAGDDIVLTFDGDNTVFGAAGMDNITTGAGSNTIFGGDDDDTINSFGTDTIFGGAGDDTIINNAGATTFDGGAGDDAMTALGGAIDTFVFEEGDGNDIITGFVQGEDLLDVSALGVSSLAELFVVDNGTNTTVLFEGGSVEVLGLTGLIADADFIF